MKKHRAHFIVVQHEMVGTHHRSALLRGARNVRVQSRRSILVMAIAGFTCALSFGLPTQAHAHLETSTNESTRAEVDSVREWLGLEAKEDVVDSRVDVAAHRRLRYVGYRSQLSSEQLYSKVSRIRASDADELAEIAVDASREPQVNPGMMFFHQNGRVYRSGAYSVENSRFTTTFSPTPHTGSNFADPVGYSKNMSQEVDFLGYTIYGDDNRQLSTSSKKNFAAVKVSLRTGFNDSTNIVCSGALISPRVVLTAAHCIAPDGADGQISFNYVYVAGRGRGYDGDVSPYGVHSPEWVVLSAGWKGPDRRGKISPRFDYAFLVLPDMRWKRYPGWVQSGIANTFRTTLYHHGYPWQNHDCEDSPLQSEQCGGYGYYEKRKTGFSFVRWFRSRHDVETGQSGGPYYKKNESYVGGRKVVGVQSTHGNTAHRINKWSFADLCEVVNGDEFETDDGTTFDANSSYHDNARCD